LELFRQCGILELFRQCGIFCFSFYCETWSVKTFHTMFAKRKKYL
jgi:hypothetical protein